MLNESSSGFTESSNEGFEAKKSRYFVRVGLAIREAFKLHKGAGLWKKEDSWRNVSEHCLVEAARVRALAGILGLSEELTHKLLMAAGLHDFNKKREKELLAENDYSWDGYEKASKESIVAMQEAGFDETTVNLASSIGHESLKQAEEILSKQGKSPEDVAFLLMHYVDDYTINDQWANPAEIDGQGKGVNDLDRRMIKNETNPRFAKINQQGIGKFEEGETTYQAQRRVGKQVEIAISDLMQENLQTDINPNQIPEIIDQKIKTEINSQVGA
jgi:hypothetical protein